jgi:hypothetical protein
MAEKLKKIKFPVVGGWADAEYEIDDKYNVTPKSVKFNIKNNLKDLSKPELKALTTAIKNAVIKEFAYKK